MEKWTEPVLIEREFRVGSRKKPLMIRLGFPRRSTHEWACAFQLKGLKNDKIQVAHGVDGLQALTVAVGAIRQKLDRLKTPVVGDEPYEFVFPQFVPMAHGLEYHRRLCRILNTEIEKKEKQLARGRSARKQRC